MYIKKQLQQEKLKNEIMQKQKDLETKSWNMPSETVSRQLLKHTPSHYESEEIRRLELEQKRKDQLEDEAIERMAREREEKIKMEFEKENEKQTLAQLQVWNIFINH